MVPSTAVKPSSSGRPGGDERAEGDEQDDQRDREGADLRLLEVLLEGLGDLLLGRRVAELARARPPDAAFCSCGDGGERGVDAVLGRVLVAGQLEGDERRAAVGSEMLPSLPFASGFSTSVDVLRVCESVADDVVDDRGVAAGRRPSGRPWPGRARTRRSGRGSRRPRGSGRRVLDSPLPMSSSASVFWPTMPPRTVARMTKANQPRIAFLRCCALQRPARAARLRDCCMWGSPSGETGETGECSGGSHRRHGPGHAGSLASCGAASPTGGWSWPTPRC